jgi:hypothetical protein
MQYKKSKDILFKQLAKLIPVCLVIMIVIAAVYYTSEKAIAQYPTTAQVYPYGVYPYNLINPYTASTYPTIADVYPYNVYPYNVYPYTPYPYTPYPYPYPQPLY